MTGDEYRPQILSRILRCAVNAVTLLVICAFIAADSGVIINIGTNTNLKSVSASSRLTESASIPPCSDDIKQISNTIDGNCIECDLSTVPMTIINETQYTPDCEALIEAFNSRSESAEAFSYTLAADSNKPIALVLHTHGTECYTPSDGIIDENFTYRSLDTEQNVVAIGAVLAQTLIDGGIPTLHCRVMHDEQSYLNSYIHAAETIKTCLNEFPSIKYIFDVHRDAIEREGAVMRPLTYQEGEPIAQVMSVVGTDERGAAHPNWQTNLTLALRLQLECDMLCPSISRAVNLRSASFNEQYAPGSLLLEIGSHGNTLDEAKRAANIVGRALVNLIKIDIEHK